MFTQLQDRLSRALGCEPAQRRAIVQSMIHRGPREVTGYWLQLLIATGISSLGLVLGSTAVIIGAMLVAPLMGPILGLGMGLATGSLVLVLRAGLRVVFSIAVVVVVSLAITRLVPYRELNAEITARTTPTALDLATAVFCAMAGVYASLRPSSDLATTAAGTSIGISLVPPLCVGGFGLALHTTPIARGAMLLFLTNFAAIVLIGTLGFAASGFGHVDVQELEDAELDESPRTLLASATFRRINGFSRNLVGPWLRLLMPVALLAALYSPLRAGLDQVAWQISARASVNDAVAALPQRVVQSRIRVERHEVEVVIFLLGSQADATAARQVLLERVTAATQVQPRIEVHAVADATEFELLERALEKPATPPTVEPPPIVQPPPPPPTLAERMDEQKQVTYEWITQRWPTSSAGRPLRILLELLAEGIELHVAHLGRALDPAAIELLEGVLSEEADGTVRLRDEAVPSTATPVAPDAPLPLLALAHYLEVTRDLEQVWVCLTEPRAAPKTRLSPQSEALGLSLHALLVTHPRARFISGDTFTFRFAEAGCETGPAPGP